MTSRLKKFGVRLKRIASDKSFMKKVGGSLVAVAYVMFVVALASEMGFADTDASTNGDDGILGNINTLLQDIQSGILKFSSVAVVIGVGVGAMMKKFSMGKQDKIEMGNKLMKDSIIAFAILNATPRIVNFITGKLGHGGESINVS